MGDFQDLMTGVDRVIEMGRGGSGAVGVMGWSLRRLYDVVGRDAD
jgi:hypothetical protein